MAKENTNINKGDNGDNFVPRDYRDLSRRGLIALNHDFDFNNNDMLKKHLIEADMSDPDGEFYEGIRPIESIVEKVDDLSYTVKSNGNAFKKAAVKAAEGVLDKVIDTLGKIVKSADNEEGETEDA